MGVRAYGLHRQCDAFTDEIIDILESADPPLRWLAINAAAIGDVDFSGADSARQIPNELVRQNAALVLCGVSFEYAVTTSTPTPSSPR